MTAEQMAVQSVFQSAFQRAYSTAELKADRWAVQKVGLKAADLAVQ